MLSLTGSLCLEQAMRVQVTTVIQKLLVEPVIPGWHCCHRRFRSDCHLPRLAVVAVVAVIAVMAVMAVVGVLGVMDVMAGRAASCMHDEPGKLGWNRGHCNTHYRSSWRDSSHRGL